MAFDVRVVEDAHSFLKTAGFNYSAPALDKKNKVKLTLPVALSAALCISALAITIFKTFHSRYFSAAAGAFVAFTSYQAIRQMVSDRFDHGRILILIKQFKKAVTTLKNAGDSLSSHCGDLQSSIKKSQSERITLNERKDDDHLREENEKLRDQNESLRIQVDAYLEKNRNLKEALERAQQHNK